VYAEGGGRLERNPKKGKKTQEKTITRNPTKKTFKKKGGTAKS
jgi:hypothetical protein